MLSSLHREERRCGLLQREGGPSRPYSTSNPCAVDSPLRSSLFRSSMRCVACVAELCEVVPLSVSRTVSHSASWSGLPGSPECPPASCLCADAGSANMVCWDPTLWTWSSVSGRLHPVFLCSLTCSLYCAPPLLFLFHGPLLPPTFSSSILCHTLCRNIDLYRHNLSSSLSLSFSSTLSS